MPPTRDPLSLRYDGHVSELMRRAAVASRSRRGIQTWIASPRVEYRQRDRGGRTPHERAFMRSAYYLIFKNGGNPGYSGWSLKLTWGSDADRKPSAAGRMVRPVTVRLFPRGEARRTSAQWLGTAEQSLPGRRIDE